MRTTHASRAAACLSSLVLFLACSDSAPPAGSGTSPGSGDAAAPSAAPSAAEGDSSSADAPARPSAPSTFVPPIDGRPAAPEHHFTDRRAQRGAGYLALRERVNAGKDGWPTEVFAGAAEQVLLEWLGGALRGEPLDSRARFAATFEGSTRLAPEAFGEPERRGALRIWRSSVPAERTLREAPAFDGELARLCDPFQSGTRREVQVEVLRMDPDPGGDPRTYDSLCHLRLSADLGDGARQLNTDWELRWRLADSGKSLEVVRLVARDHELLELDLRPFAEKTGAVLAGTRFARDEHSVGALELWERCDRLSGATSVYIGMQGMAVGDLDGDGLEDLYLAQPAGRPNELFLQGPGAELIEAGASAGVDFLDETSGVTIVDLDGDGARDLAMGQGPDVLILWNDGSAHFEERTLLEGTDAAQVYSIDVADPDGDGDLDLYATRYVGGGVIGGVPTPYHDAENGATNFYWRATGPRTYELATEAVGLDQNNTRFSLDAMWEDLDGDGDLDLYVTNDFGRNNLYRNDGERFIDIAGDTGTDDMAAGMGISSSDVDRDGHLDLYVSNMYTSAGSRITSQPGFMPTAGLELRAMYQMHTRGNSLLLGSAEGVFRDRTHSAGVGPGGWTWGAMFTDFDGDGYEDLVVPNGFLTGVRTSRDLESFFWRAVVNASPLEYPPSDEYREAWVAISAMSQQEGLSWNGSERNYAYWNVGEGRFVDASALSGLDYVDDARCVCLVDWDRDGRPDLWLRNRTAPTLRFLHNRSAPSAWIAFELAGAAPNTDAIGARLTLEARGRRVVKRVHGGAGYLSSSSLRQHFGLGAPVKKGEEEVATVTVEWPGGQSETHAGLALERAWRLAPGAAPEALAAPDRSALAAAPAKRLAEGSEGARARVVALDKMPLSSVDLPVFEGAPRRVGAFGGPLFVLLWGSFDDASIDALRALAAARASFAGAGVALHPITLDEVRDTDYARSVLAGLGVAPEGGRLDRRTRAILEMLLMEILGNYADLPLPVGILFDGAGSPAVLYVGEIDVARVLADAREASSDPSDPNWRWDTRLSGGRWRDKGPFRALGPMTSYLRRAGFPELAQEFKLEIERRKDERQARKRDGEDADD